MGKGRMTAPTTGRRTGLMVIRVGELSLPLTCCSTWERAGPIAHVGNTKELAMDVGVEDESSPKT